MDGWMALKWRVQGQQARLPWVRPGGHGVSPPPRRIDEGRGDAQWTGRARIPLMTQLTEPAGTDERRTGAGGVLRKNRDNSAHSEAAAARRRARRSGTTQAATQSAKNLLVGEREIVSAIFNIR